MQISQNNATHLMLDIHWTSGTILFRISKHKTAQKKPNKCPIAMADDIRLFRSLVQLGGLEMLRVDDDVKQSSPENDSKYFLKN